MNTNSKSGLIIAFSAFFLWGITPIYFKWVEYENPLDIVANRVLWSALLLGIILTVMAKWQLVKQTILSFKTLKILVCTTILIGTNWLVFVYAVSTDRMLDGSLGYYINPLVNVLLAYLFLGERLRKIQWLALALAMVGVAIQVVGVGYLPWISIVLALSFGFYGLLHKKSQIDSFTSLFVETSILLPFGLLFMGYLFQIGEGPATRELSGWIILILSGPITTVPLLLFSIAAKKVTLSTIGFFQYIAPSMVFLLAVFVYGEALTLAKAITFLFIWAGLALYVFDSIVYGVRNKNIKN
ncbi:EamA family transporter RarD [Marinomonas agarivorans]|nr:EamA family transporter RarD [Marinomonas agarivorans]